MDIPIHLANEIIYAAENVNPIGAADGSPPHPDAAFATLLVHGKASASTTAGIVSLEPPIPMSYEFYRFIKGLIDGPPATTFLVEPHVIVVPIHPGPSRFCPLIPTEICQDFDFYTEMSDCDTIIINGYSDDSTPGQGKMMKSADALARAKFCGDLIKSVVLEKEWVATPRTRAVDIAYQYDSVRNPPHRPKVDYHAIFSLLISTDRISAVAAQIWRDSPSSLDVYKGIAYRLTAIQDWAQDYDV